ncbi:MAG: rSAM/selenodomain-associated transferase 1 [Gammaproteobacteria bacterium]|jgi:rSAM/selenodomain-associated transferase 1
MNPSTAVIVFARAPQLGRVKTRLTPSLGEQGALDLYRAMLRHALEVANQCAADELILACTPDTRDPQLRDMGKAVGARLEAQQGVDLGARMCYALSGALHRHQVALLIGSDCPSLQSADLLDARKRALNEQASARDEAMVFIPATDGGYVLVGGSACWPEIFVDMPWGTADVMKQTRQRLRSKRHTWHELEAQHDIDTAEDLVFLPEGLRESIAVAPKF